MAGKVAENPAALRAAVFSLSSKNLRGGGVQTPPPSRARVNKATSTYNLYISDFWYIDDLGSGQDPDLSIMSQWGKYWNPSQRISKV